MMVRQMSGEPASFELQSVRLDDITVMLEVIEVIDPRLKNQGECVRRLQTQACGRFSWRKSDILTTGLQCLEPARAARDEGKGWATIPENLSA